MNLKFWALIFFGLFLISLALNIFFILQISKFTKTINKYKEYMHILHNKFNSIESNNKAKDMVKDIFKEFSNKQINK